MRTIFALALCVLAPLASIGSAQSSLDDQPRTRCLTPERDPSLFPGADLPPSDCGYNSTNPSEAYAPTFTYDIPVVVHVIQNTGGTGYISPTMVQSQIDILNEDFLALVGTNGAPGTNAQVRFYLATEDPGGNPTTGITYTTNNTWFADNGAYWNTLGWDTNRYMNIYTNNASGALGYVPDLPQGGLAGQPHDRVVVLWSAFGRNAPYGAPYNQGRTLTHEVGHYVGLNHTFSGGCGSISACYTTGDLICDTNRESSPTFGCPTNKSSCSSSDPIRNYMDYSDDLCMWEFTTEQIRRMRCTLEFYRPLVWSVGTCGAVANYCTAGTSASGCQALISASGTPSATAASGFDVQASGVEGQKDGLFFFGTTGRQALAWGNGSSFQCVVAPLVRTGLMSGNGTAGACDGTPSRDLNALWCPTCPKPAKNPGAGATAQLQFWYRDPANTSNQTTGLSDAIEFSICP